MIRYQDERASSYCKTIEPFCNSKVIINNQITDIYCILWFVSAHKYKLENHRELVSNYTKLFHEITQGDIQFHMN